MRTPPAKDHQTWTDFARAHVRVHLGGGPVTVRPAPARVGAFPDEFGGRPVHVITAWNPGGTKTTSAANEAAQAALAADVAALGVPSWSAVGFDPTDDWHEDSIAVVGLTRADACALGDRFAQAAIFEWVDEPDGLRVVACDGRLASAMAWALDA